MKAVILAGGHGTRLSEETYLKPKPMVEIGEMPILWHIMKIYSYHGINDFVICLGYKGNKIKEYFSNYFLYTTDVTFDFLNQKNDIHRNTCEPWKITLVNTGYDTKTGGRLKRVRRYVEDEDFCFTYGDGLSDVNIKQTIEYHKSHAKHATMTVVRPAGRYGVLDLQGDSVCEFKEKPVEKDSWINGGFFVLSPSVFDYIDGDSTVWEKEPLERLTADRQLKAYKHTGFWQAMDTLRDKNYLEELWAQSNPPWKIWEDIDSDCGD